MDISFKAELWEYPGKAAWCFMSVPTKYYDVIKEIAAPLKKGFGSIRVEVTVGVSKWKTSIFPDNKTKTYLLPIKKSIRVAENIKVGDKVSVLIYLIES